MNSKSRFIPFSVIFTLMIILVLACSTSSTSPSTSNDAGLQQTMIALSVAETSVALQQAQIIQQPAVQATVGVPVAPPVQPTVEVPAAPPAQPAADTLTEAEMDEKIRNAKILLFEDTWQIGSWVYDSIKAMGLMVTNDGDAVGHFVEHLNSAQWDLVIVVGEYHAVVQGEIWDQIMTTLNRSNKPAFIGEVWYLDHIGEGKIKSFTTECGIEWQKELDSAVPYFWLAPDSPVASNPGPVPSLTGGGGFWNLQDAGDEVRLLPGSKAILLAGTHSNDNSQHGVITSCFNGRVIFQTFCDHDFKRGTIQSLWKNYITNVLEAHFKAIQ